MFFNYFKIGIRKLVKERVYSLINILGLTAGIASFILIMLYVRYEITFDNHVKLGDHMYRCVEIQHPSGLADQHVAMTMEALGPALKRSFPEITEFLRIQMAWKTPVQYEEKILNQPYMVFTDPSVFRLYNIELIYGDTATALSEPRNIVMAESVARKYFDTPEEAMEKVFMVDNENGYKVTGIMKDLPRNMHMRMEILASFSTSLEKYEWVEGWETNCLTTYVLVDPQTDIAALESKFTDFLVEQLDVPEEDRAGLMELYLQPFRDIHLKSGHIKFQNNYNPGNIVMVWVMTIIAILIVFIASINYINISIARSIRRAKEVGMRKVLGANRADLIRNFLGESLILTFISMILAMIIVELLLPTYNDILRTDFHIDFIGNPIFNWGLILIWLTVGLLSGAYPAFYLSRFQPAIVMKAGKFTPTSGTSMLRKGLVVFQFVISITLIFSILVIFGQIHYAMNKDLGYNFKNVMCIPLYMNNSPDDIALIQSRLAMNPHVSGISANAGPNGVTGTQTTIHVDDTTGTRLSVRLGAVDENYFDMMDIPVIKGRNFDKRHALDEKEAVIVNEAAASYLGWDNILDVRFHRFYGDDTTITNRRVIGVISDYHYYSLHSKIEPAVYIMNPMFYSTICARIEEGKEETVNNFTEGIWNDLFPGSPYESYFAQENLRRNYYRESNILKIFSFFAILSVIISVLGLYGLTALTIQQKTREIGIRKVLGGSVKSISLGLIRQFILLIFLAGLIACPIGWYLMDRGLSSFAYRVDISWYYFVAAILSAVVIAVLTIIYQAYKAAKSNPVDAIAYE